MCVFEAYQGKYRHEEQGVKNGKKFHHQEAKRRTCSQEQGRREPAAEGIPLHGEAAFNSQKGKKSKKGKKLDLCPPSFLWL